MKDHHRNKLDTLLARHRLAAEQARAEKQALRQAKRQARHALTAQDLAQKVAALVQDRCHRQIASVVTRCLRAIWGDEAYDFKIAFERRRGKTEAKLLFVRDDNELDPKSAAGGGVLNVAAFALRLACLVLSQPRKRKLLILDEGFAHLHGAEQRAKVCLMIETLAREMGVQFVLVTQDGDMRVGKVIDL